MLHEALQVEIKVYYDGVLIDHYIQGRPGLEVSSISDTFRQLELF